jgi:hypothetical protein
MAADSLISARVTADTKARFAAGAQSQGLSESALLKRLVAAFLTTAVAVNSESIAPVEPVARSGKLSVRLRPNDLLLLRERARGSTGMPWLCILMPTIPMCMLSWRP